MPNNTYKHVQNKLATMVSTRAVKRILRSSLKDKGLTPDNVDVASMIKILKGPVFREFQLILPRDGLKKNLNQLMSELKAPTPNAKENNLVSSKRITKLNLIMRIFSQIHYLSFGLKNQTILIQI